MYTIWLSIALKVLPFRRCFLKHAIFCFNINYYVDLYKIFLYYQFSNNRKALAAENSSMMKLPSQKNSFPLGRHGVQNGDAGSAAHKAKVVKYNHLVDSYMDYSLLTEMN